MKARLKTSTERHIWVKIHNTATGCASLCGKIVDEGELTTIPAIHDRVCPICTRIDATLAERTGRDE